MVHAFSGHEPERIISKTTHLIFYPPPARSDRRRFSSLENDINLHNTAAIQAGYKVIYREAHTFFEDLFEATQLKRRKKATKLFSETDLLIIDDLFLRKNIPEQTANDLLEIIMNRYSSKKSSVITSNRPLDDWGKLLQDNACLLGSD